MATTGDSSFDAFLEDARRRAAEAPIPDRVLNEVRILLLLQRREMRNGASIRELAFNLDGLDWRTRWVVPRILEVLSEQGMTFRPFGEGVAQALRLTADMLSNGVWNLADAGSLLHDHVDIVYAFGKQQTWVGADQGRIRAGIRGADDVRRTAASIVDLAAIGQELAVLAWARVIGVQDAWMTLVAAGRSQADAHLEVVGADVQVPTTFSDLASLPIETPIPSEWDFSPLPPGNVAK